ncbi:MAG: TRAP transporter small permease [Siculibacillus sp.]|nr:TRAP transporter small permease [Siculibacillus sp.]
MPRAFALLGRAVDLVVAGLSALGLVALLCVVTLGIVGRAVGAPFAWTEELSGYLMVWLACLGTILATRNRAHIRIRVLIDLLPTGAWRITETLTQVMVALIGAVLFVKGIELVHKNGDIEAVAMPIATAWMYLPLVPTGAIVFVQAVVDLVARALAGRRETGKDFVL